MTWKSKKNDCCQALIQPESDTDYSDYAHLTSKMKIVLISVIRVHIYHYSIMEKNAKIYVAGHHGLVGSAIWKNLQDKGYTNLIGRTHKELDLLDGVAVRRFSTKNNRSMYFWPLLLWAVSWPTAFTVPTLFIRTCKYSRTLSVKVSAITSRNYCFSAAPASIRAMPDNR